MTIFLSRAAVAAAAIVLSAGSTPLNRGTIAIEPATPVAAPERPPPDVAEGLGEALSAQGFTMLSDSGHSAYVAEVTFVRTVVGTGSAKVSNGRAAVAPGLFGAAGGGVTVPLPAGQTRSVALERFQLDLRIRKRQSGQIAWHGVAVTVRAHSARDSVRGIASSLAEAALRFYPNAPPGIVSVP